MRLRYAKLSPFKIRNVLKCFCEDHPANKTAAILWLNANTAERYYTIFREKIIHASLHEAQFSREVGGR